MARRSRTLGVVLALGVLPVLGAVVARAQLLANGGELQANNHTDGAQLLAAVSIAPNGEFVVVWQSDGQDGNGYGIFLRQFEADGAPLSGDLQVNTFTVGAQQSPAIGMDSDGGFVVVWQSQPNVFSDIFGRRFDAAGQAIGGEFQVNTITGEYLRTPGVAVRGDGGFIVVWTGDGPNGLGVFARRYDAAGTTVGTVFEVPANTASPQLDPAVAIGSLRRLRVAVGDRVPSQQLHLR